MEPALSDRKLTILSALPVKNDGKMSKIRKEKAEKTFPRKDEEGFCLSNIIFSFFLAQNAFLRRFCRTNILNVRILIRC